MDFDLQPTLENDRVSLRPLCNKDFDELFDVASDPLIWEQHPSKRYKRNEFKIFFEESLMSIGALIIIDKSSGEIIGSSRFKKIDGNTDAVEIGWSFLSRKYWGGKFNMEIKKLMIDYAFKHVDHVIFYIDEDNIRSQKAIEKINGERISESEYPILKKKNDRNLIYRLNKKDWIL